MEEVFRAKLNNEGRMNIPVACRQRLGFQPGQEVLMQISNGQLLVYTQEQTLKRIQDWVASAVPVGGSLADGLTAQRRMEVVKEARE
jgi:bifunctional DNA-binding transcriptional regulator/antitoxin component of YhaV-PrlF toxin-antitoxin module